MGVHKGQNSRENGPTRVLAAFERPCSVGLAEASWQSAVSGQRRECLDGLDMSLRRKEFDHEGEVHAVRPGQAAKRPPKARFVKLCPH